MGPPQHWPRAIPRWLVTHVHYFHPTLELRLLAMGMKQEMICVTRREQHNFLVDASLQEHSLHFLAQLVTVSRFLLVVIWHLQLLA